MKSVYLFFLLTVVCSQSALAARPSQYQDRYERVFLYQRHLYKDRNRVLHIFPATNIDGSFEFRSPPHMEYQVVNLKITDLTTSILANALIEIFLERPFYAVKFHSPAWPEINMQFVNEALEELLSKDFHFFDEHYNCVSALE